MSIKDYFYSTKQYKVISSSSMDEIGKTIESSDYVDVYVDREKQFVPDVDFSSASNFAKFGSAEEYYDKALKSIYKTFPYDGSLREKTEWHYSASYLDNYVFDKLYPRTNGFVSLGYGWNEGTGATSETVSADDNDIFRKSAKPQYISVKGGPNAPSAPVYATSPLKLDWKNAEHRANYWNTTSSQINNFSFGGGEGNTVEFWFKSGDNYANDERQISISECAAYFDLHNGISIGDANYARFLIEARRSAQNTFQNSKLFHVTCMSGTYGCNRVGIGDSSLITTSTLASWNHFAFSVENR
jgi:hypothetical protein